MSITPDADDFTGEGSCAEEDDYLRAQYAADLNAQYASDLNDELNAQARHDWRDDDIVLGLSATRFCWNCGALESSPAAKAACDHGQTFDS